MLRGEKQSGQGHPFASRESELKICELCGHLNPVASPGCFVCGWHGRFETNPEVVRAAMELAQRRYGHLELPSSTETPSHPPVALLAIRRFRGWFARLWQQWRRRRR